MLYEAAAPFVAVRSAKIFQRTARVTSGERYWLENSPTTPHVICLAIIATIDVVSERLAACPHLGCCESATVMDDL